MTDMPIEPGAHELMKKTLGTVNGTATQEQMEMMKQSAMLFSAAVSLKRIADVLEGSDAKSGLIYMLDQIAVGAQGRS